jgi:glycosyltransferase involved in cell wall biosynthesis
MAGMGIRAYEIARALAAEFEVVLLVPEGSDRTLAPPGIEWERFEIARVERSLSRCAAAVVSGHLGAELLRRTEVPAAVDWYDPFLVENFRYRDLLGPTVEANDRAAWGLMISRGDFFLCASEEQRLFYLGMLVEAGRVTAVQAGADPALERLLAIVPFGVAPRAPGRPEETRARIGASPEDPVVLFGGLYDWYDPAPLLSAWERLLVRFPGARLLFCESPNRETTPQEALESASAQARRRGWLDRCVFFLPWTPYDRRGDLYSASTVAACCCRPGLETDLSFRTRLLDAASFGLPSVSIHGGTLARALEAAGAGRCARDEASLERALAAYLGDAELRREASARASRFAADFEWPRVVEPLAAWLRNPVAGSRALSTPPTRGSRLFRREHA